MKIQCNDCARRQCPAFKKLKNKGEYDFIRMNCEGRIAPPKGHALIYAMPVENVLKLHARYQELQASKR